MPQTRYPRRWRWPNDGKIAVSVAIAYEAFELRSQYGIYSEPGRPDYFSLSYGDYGWKSGAWRLLDLMDEVGLKFSMTTNGLAAERHPEVVRAAAAAGHEIVGHGWANDHFGAKDTDPEQELEEIRRCTRTLTEAAGGARPVGWTSPGSSGSLNTHAFLRGEGYIWNGDDASDDLPFLRDTAHGPIVMLPRTNLAQSDLIMWWAPRNPPDIVWDGFKATFDQLYSEGEAGSPKWIEISLHCHFGGRPTMTSTLKKCFAYAKSHDGVWYARKRDIAEWTLEHERAKLA
jgi:peptidoglycan/xylan/chitin deacetylase (PgdA/CDA1 family)